MLKARRKRSKLSMTSLIDVIFLLLLFFMLTSTFTKFAEVELLSKQQGAGTQAASDAAPLFVRIGENDLSLNATPVTLDRLAQLITSQRSTQDGQPVLISVSSDASAQRLTDIIIVLRALPGLTISVLGASA